MDELSTAKQDFALETTLASRSFLPFIQKCQNDGYSFALLYVWLQSADLAVERVARRVASGGHHIPADTIRRRYERGKANFFDLYQSVCDDWSVFDNSGLTSQLIAHGGREIRDEILNSSAWSLIKPEGRA